MQKQLTKQALISLLASLLATAAISQERGEALATVPEYSDEPSGGSASRCHLRGLKREPH